MAEDSHQKREDHLQPPFATHQPGAEDTSEAHAPKSTLPHLSKAKLYEKRQKCELRRLLKHTNPELKMLDEAVDEELAEVLSSECDLTAAESGYEGEVLSRRLIFEKCASSNKEYTQTLMMHMSEGTVERGDASKTSAVVEEQGEWLSSNPDPTRECEEEIIRVDVQSTRRMFENRCVDTFSPSSDNRWQGKVFNTEDDTGAVQKQTEESEISNKENLHGENKSSSCVKSLGLREKPHRQRPCVHVAGQTNDHEFSENQQGSKRLSIGEEDFGDQVSNFPNSGGFEERIKTSATLFQNNPFISANVETENSYTQRTKAQKNTSYSGEPADNIVANVKNRTHLFESMPFDKIRQQNDEEMETMVENIKETLNSLYRFHTIHSDGSIIEVNDTMIAKKAKFILSETGPKIKYDEVAEGGAQNFIVQLLPRANLKPQVTYLKEDIQGSMKTTVVNVRVHQHHFDTNHDIEFKTANVVQIVEDILNQDNSLRKGVIIQQDMNGCAEVIVYSLYNYAEGDVKGYIPPQGYSIENAEAESKQSETNKTHNQVTTQDQSCPRSLKPEVTIKGNVKLFKSCIEKGDLEYLRSLQAEAPEQECSPNQTGHSMEPCHDHRDHQEEESTLEWAPVDIKRLKNIFSADQREFQQKQCDHPVQSSIISLASTGQNVHLGKEEPSTEYDVGTDKCGSPSLETALSSNVGPQRSSCLDHRAHPVCLHLDKQDDNMVHQAELVEVADEDNEIFNLQNAIHCLQQATMEAKELIASTVAGENPRMEAELPQEIFQKQSTLIEPILEAPPSVNNITSEHKPENQQETPTSTCANTDIKNTQNTESYSATCEHEAQIVHNEQTKTAMETLHSSATKPAQQEDEEVVLQGTLQAAFDSLEKSNVNITRGDFRAAMIYRNSSKSHKERLQIVDAASVQKPTVTETQSTVSARQEVVTEADTGAKLEAINQSQTPNSQAPSVVTKKSRRDVGPKPAIPPKPEHLKVKHNQLVNTEKPEPIQTNSEMKKQLKDEKPPQSLPATSILYKKEDFKDLSKPKSGTETESDEQKRNELYGKVIQIPQANQTNHQVQGLVITMKNETNDFSSFPDKNNVNQPEALNATSEEKHLQDSPLTENRNETDDDHIDFYEACQKFGGKKVNTVKNAPIKPKRAKINQCDKTNLKQTPEDNSTTVRHVHAEQQTLTDSSRKNPNDLGQTIEKEMTQESKVQMREKKVKIETEDERRQRLSVHMDEIVRGNITAAMEIFDNLRKQEELQNILDRVEEIEKDTSGVDVRSLRRIFENVPTWVVNAKEKKQKKAKAEQRVHRSPLCKDNAEGMSSMANVFGDLERASEEIMNLKEQTIARLMDIEEAIKKALYSVSTLKSESDIAGLSCLFKESLMTAQESLSSDNISKISIGSSRTKTLQALESPTTVSQGRSLDVASGKSKASPPSSPAFISIQSAARRTEKTEVLPPEATACTTCQQSPKTEEKFRTTKTLKCSSAAQNKKDPRKGGQKQTSSSPLKPKRELSVLQVQTDPEGTSVVDTKTITENYERTDNTGNRFYSSKTSTVITTQPETRMTSRGQAVSSPATLQVTTYPEVQPPINRKP